MTIPSQQHRTDAVSGRLLGLSMAFFAGMAVVAVPIVFVVAPLWNDIAHGELVGLVRQADFGNTYLVS